MRRRYPHCNKIDGPFAPRLITMLKSPAYRALSLSAHRVLTRLEIELYQHGGEGNGKLIVTYEHFIEYGIDKEAIAPALRQLVALGFIEVTEQGRAGAGSWHEPNQFRLTYRPVGNARPTHEWQRIETAEEAVTIIRAARNAPASKNRTPPRKNRSFHPGKTGVERPVSAPEKPGYGPPRKNRGTSISRVHVSMADTGLPPKACHREPAVNGVEHEPTATVPLDVQELDRLRSEPAPWSTPTVEEIPWDTLLTELANGGTRAPLDAAYQATTEKQPDAVADVSHQAETQALAVTPPWEPPWDVEAARAAAEAYVPPSALADTEPAAPWVPYSQRDIDHRRHSREGLMTRVADVIEEQLRNLDEAEKAKRKAAQQEAQPAPAARQKDEAADFLRNILGKGEVSAEKVQQAARKANIAPFLLQSACEVLQVKSRREETGLCTVYWALPAAASSARKEGAQAATAV